MFHKNVSARELLIAVIVLIVDPWAYRHKKGNETKYLRYMLKSNPSTSY